jgi:hypothetical protein
MGAINNRTAALEPQLQDTCARDLFAHGRFPTKDRMVQLLYTKTTLQLRCQVLRFKLKEAVIKYTPPTMNSKKAPNKRAPIKETKGLYYKITVKELGQKEWEGMNRATLYGFPDLPPPTSHLDHSFSPACIRWNSSKHDSPSAGTSRQTCTQGGGSSWFPRADWPWPPPAA